MYIVYLLPSTTLENLVYTTAPPIATHYTTDDDRKRINNNNWYSKITTNMF